MFFCPSIVSIILTEYYSIDFIDIEEVPSIVLVPGIEVAPGIEVVGTAVKEFAINSYCIGEAIGSLFVIYFTLLLTQVAFLSHFQSLRQSLIGCFRTALEVMSDTKIHLDFEADEEHSTGRKVIDHYFEVKEKSP